MIGRSSTFSFRVSNQDLESFEKKVKSPENPSGKFKNLSECVRECAKVGCKVLDYQEMMKDPDKADEFRKKMEDVVKAEQATEWAQTLDSQQIEGFLMLLQMEKEQRYVQKKFL